MATIAVYHGFLEGVVYRDGDSASAEHFPVGGQVGRAVLGKPERFCKLFGVQVVPMVRNGLLARQRRRLHGAGSRVRRGRKNPQSAGRSTIAAINQT